MPEVGRREAIVLVDPLDWKGEPLEDHLPRELTMPLRRALVYHAAQIARADGDYAAAERASVMRASSRLGVEPAIVTALESLLEMEESLKRARHALLHAPAAADPGALVRTTPPRDYRDRSARAASTRDSECGPRP